LGQIKEQTIKGSVFSYFGVLLGFAISGLLLPKLFTTGENGLIKLLIAYSSMFAQFATLGFTYATGRLFSYFRDEKTNHHGFFGLTMLVMVAGFIVSIISFYFLKDFILNDSKDGSELLSDYLIFLVPLIFFTLLYLMLDSYFKMLFQTVIGTFVKEFLLRFLILASILLFYLEVINFREFILAYIIANSLPGLILLVAVLISGKVNWKPDFTFIKPDLARSLSSMSFYGIMIGFSGIMILNIDSIMISKMVGIEATGIYAITYFFGTLIIIPSRSLRKIAGTILAEAWRKNDLETIASVYRKSSINQLIIGILIFIGLWGNIHNVFEILPAVYKAGMWVIFFVALTNLIEMTSGVSEIMIQTSKNYRYGAFLFAVFLLLVLVFNFIFIKSMGLVGAAVANTVSYIIYNIMRYVYIYRNYGMQPFSFKHVYAVLAGIFVYGISLLVPIFGHYIPDIAVRSTLMVVVYGFIVYKLNLSEDINQSADQLIRRLTGNRKRK
jgi:O-antigen/teichoic acid export membrane protein